MKETKVGMCSRHIELVDYDPAWADFFELDKKRLFEVLGSISKGLKIDHIGSTAIPTVPKAKPIIDIAIRTENLENVGKILRENGMWVKGDIFRNHYIKAENPSECCGSPVLLSSLFIRGFDDNMLQRKLMFKQFLIENPQKAQEYFEAKLRAQVSSMREQYSRADEDGVVPLRMYSFVKGDLFFDKEDY
jgi:GrpB-like predicted nucleotidyltransferase (UPF0157 family)